MINGHFKAIKRQNRDSQRDYTSDLAIAHCGLRSSHIGLLTVREGSFPVI